MKTLLKIVVSIISLIPITTECDAQLLGQYEFNAGADCFITDPNPIDKKVTLQPEGATFSSIDASSYDPCVPNALEFRTQTWTNSPTPIAYQFYYFFSVTACGTCVLNLNQIDLDIYRNTSPSDKGPDSGAVYISIDGAPYVRQGNVFFITATKTTFTQLFSANSIIGGNIAFRITAWNAKNSGTNSELLLDNVKVYGTTPPGPLPVELLSFTADIMNDEALLHWITASEQNNDFFSVEKTKDEKNFFCAAKVKGSGTTATVMNYFAADKNPYAGISYYRLRQTDFNGQSTFSQLVEISFSSDSPEINIYPNPANADACLTLSGFSEKEILVVVYDVLGNETFSKIIVLDNNGNECTAADMWQKLSHGIYFVTASANNRLYKKKLVVQ